MFLSLYLLYEIGRTKITLFWNLSGNPDTYLKGESKRSVILTFSPLARLSIVSMRGITLLFCISAIVDFGTSVRTDTWRTVRFLRIIYSCNNIFMGYLLFWLLSLLQKNIFLIWLIRYMRLIILQMREEYKWVARKIIMEVLGVLVL